MPACVCARARVCVCVCVYVSAEGAAVDPPNMSEHIAREVSAGMPTSHGKK